MGDGIKKSGSCFAKIAPQFLHLSKISPKLKGLCNPGPFKKSRPYFEPSCRNTGGAHLEVTPGFEPGNESFADSCLTTWLCHHIRETAFRGRFSVWSGRRGSNSLPRPWQGRALPDELRPHMAPVFQHHGASGRSRTNDTRIFSPLLYQLSYRGKWRPRWGSNPRPPA